MIMSEQNRTVRPSPQKTKKDSKQGLGDVTYEKRKKAHTGCMTGVLYIVVILAASFGLAVFGWACANDVLALMKDESKVEIEVPEDIELSQLARTLEEAGVIEHAWLFNFYCKISEAYVEPGTYDLDLPLDYRAIVYALRKGSEQAKTVEGVTIREGLSLEQTLDILVENGVSTMDKLMEAVENYDFSHEFIVTLPKTPTRLEGYLYPDTYDFFVNEDPHLALNKLLNNFDRKLTTDFRDRIEDMDYSLHEIIIIASLIEMESRDNMDDKKNIASVIYNRLESTSMRRLQIDATIQYFLPERVTRVLNEHLAIDNPYNTYIYEGLPPGPICSPSIDSIRAALYPYETGYYYYALQDDGTHGFSKTEAEHEAIKRNNPKTYGT